MTPVLTEPLVQSAWSDRLWRLWPQLPLAAAIMLSGALNIISGLRYDGFPSSELEPLLHFDTSLPMLGSSSQLFLGVLLIIVGVGLIRRLAVAWSFALLLLVITVGVNVVQERWQASLFLPGVMLIILLALRPHFNRRAPGANFFFSLIGILAILAYGSFGSFLLGRGFEPKISDLATGLYFTIVTISTVGYGEITPANLETRLFVVSLIIVGLSVFATITASVVGPALSGELARLFRPEEEKLKPKNHVILAGDGPLATNAARELVAKGISSVMIASETPDFTDPSQQVVMGNPCEESVLREAGIATARLVIAARDDDGENAFIALVSKDINPEVSVLAIASSAKAIPRLKLARADLVFAPHVLGGRLLVDLATGKELSAEQRELLEGTES